MDGSSWLPLVWGQVGSAGGPGSGAGAGPGPGPAGGSLLELSLRRWLGGLTLSPTGVRGGEMSEGSMAFLAAAAGLLALVLAVQGPRRAWGQLVDLRGHLDLLDAAIGRVRRAGRLLMIVVGMTVVSWTGSQGARYANEAGRVDLATLAASRRLIDVAWAQGTLASLTPIRDVVLLGQMGWMLTGATFVLFQFATFRWSAARPDPEIRARVTRWATIGWAVTGLMLIYRFVGQVASGFGDRPLGGCLLGAEALIVPTLMALADGVLVAWVLTELRQVHGTDDRLDVTSVVLTIPAAVVGCLLAFPARYLAVGVVLGSEYVPQSVLADQGAAALLRWELSTGLIAWQAVGLVLSSVLGVAAWSGRVRWGTARGWFAMLRGDGGRVAVAVLAGGLAAGLAATLAYVVVLALPNAPWVLLAADSYAHYATLPIGLVTLAALVELAGRSAVVPPKPGTVAEDWAG